MSQNWEPTEWEGSAWRGPWRAGSKLFKLSSMQCYRDIANAEENVRTGVSQMNKCLSAYGRQEVQLLGVGYPENL